MGASLSLCRRMMTLRAVSSIQCGVYRVHFSMQCELAVKCSIVQCCAMLCSVEHCYALFCSVVKCFSVFFSVLSSGVQF